MDFDSHTSGVVTALVAAVNVVTPGWSRGRPYAPPAGRALAEQLHAILRGSAPVDEVDALAAYLGDLRAAFDAMADNDVDGACRRVNDLLGLTGAAPVLARHDGEAWHLHYHAKAASWSISWAAAMATAMAMVLGSAAHDRLGVCEAPACDRVYVDTSRNGARRFCSTACQNRVKAATFRERGKART
ncbi:MAG TPA: CGNR zinc finger domain-containing protein [Pseudonocardiaceae bacterium]